jgi:hypothetical protein
MDYLRGKAEKLSSTTLLMGSSIGSLDIFKLLYAVL